MKRMNGTRVAGLVASIAGAVVLSVAALHANGTLKLEKTSTLLNPCNGELVTGPVDVLLNVKVSESANGVKVKAHRSFHGELTGNQGNSYMVSSIGNAEFDATAPFYDFEFRNNVVGHGSAPDFEVIGIVRVFVDANQQPTNYGASVISSSCK